MQNMIKEFDRTSILLTAYVANAFNISSEKATIHTAKDINGYYIRIRAVKDAPLLNIINLDNVANLKKYKFKLERNLFVHNAKKEITALTLSINTWNLKPFLNRNITYKEKAALANEYILHQITLPFYSTTKIDYNYGYISLDTFSHKNVSELLLNYNYIRKDNKWYPPKDIDSLLILLAINGGDPHAIL